MYRFGKTALSGITTLSLGDCLHFTIDHLFDALLHRRHPRLSQFSASSVKDVDVERLLTALSRNEIKSIDLTWKKTLLGSVSVAACLA